MVILELLQHQRQVGVLVVVVVDAAVEAGAGLVSVEAVFEVTRMAAEQECFIYCRLCISSLSLV